MKIAFHIDQFDVRGTCVALYDYAHFNEKLLKNNSIIICPKTGRDKSDLRVIKKFQVRFSLYFYSSLEDMDKYLLDSGCYLLYCIKYGKNDGVYSKKVKTAIHCVFDMSEPHGDFYVAISDSLAKKFGKTEFLPHMISLTPSLIDEDFRTELSIPKSAIVFGRYGGLDTFNLLFCHNVITRIVKERKDIYFLFSNTPIFANHPQIKFIDSFVDLETKRKFINTCDAHLECCTLGHSFGLAMGEFSVFNKPIIAYNGLLWNRAHLDILKDKSILFRNETEFENILQNFKKEHWKEKDVNCYRSYTPTKVMEEFKRVFKIS